MDTEDWAMMGPPINLFSGIAHVIGVGFWPHKVYRPLTMMIFGILCGASSMYGLFELPGADLLLLALPMAETYMLMQDHRYEWHAKSDVGTYETILLLFNAVLISIGCYA